jgi:Ser/Thr protein kinase RdoA (MazF antagonist)
MRRLVAGRRKRVERLLADWTPEEIETFGRLLGRLNEATEKYGDLHAREVEQELSNG